MLPRPLRCLHGLHRGGLEGAPRRTRPGEFSRCGVWSLQCGHRIRSLARQPDRRLGLGTVWARYAICVWCRDGIGGLLGVRHPCQTATGNAAVTPLSEATSASLVPKANTLEDTRIVRQRGWFLEWLRHRRDPQTRSTNTIHKHARELFERRLK